MSVAAYGGDGHEDEGLSQAQNLSKRVRLLMATQEQTKQHRDPTGGVSLLDVVASLGSIGAGVYLVLSKTVAPNSYLQVIAHGIGIYFIAKGLFIGRSLYLAAESTKALRKLTELSALHHQRESRGQE